MKVTKKKIQILPLMFQDRIVKSGFQMTELIFGNKTLLRL